MKLTKPTVLFLGSALGIIALYFFLRLLNILTLPMFTDEAIYIRWAQIAGQDANWRFISLTDGKQPSFVWIAMLIMKVVSDPLLAGRLVSVVAGFATTVGLFFLGSEAFRQKSKTGQYTVFDFSKKTVSIGLLCSLIYVIYPFGLVYDRMALYDSLVGAFSVWALYLLILLVRTLRLDVAFIAGLVIGGGMLTKTNAFFSLGSIPFLLILFDWSKKLLKKRFVKFVLLTLVPFVLANVIYSILRLSPFFHIIAEKTALFAYPFSEWIKHPFTYFWSNLSALVDWFVRYVTVPGILLAALSFVINRDNFREKLVLVLWFLFPYIYLAFFGNTIYPRFILLMTLSLIPLIAYSIYQLSVKYETTIARSLILLFAFGYYLYADYFIVSDFAKAPIPRADTGQYVNNWSAGNGLKQSVEFFKKEAESKKIMIFTQGTFGLMPYGLEIYLVDNPNIKIEAIWPIENMPPKEVIESSKKMPTFAIFYQPCPSCKGTEMPTEWKGHEITQYKQGISDYYYRIYQILP